jgi:hypothetical protein
MVVTQRKRGDKDNLDGNEKLLKCDVERRGWGRR